MHALFLSGVTAVKQVSSQGLYFQLTVSRQGTVTTAGQWVLWKPCKSFWSLLMLGQPDVSTNHLADW